MDKCFICEHCEETYPIDQCYIASGVSLCESCANEESYICSHCGERILRDRNAGDENMPLCQSCYDQRYTTCEDCGRVIRQDHAYYYGEDDDTTRCYDCHIRMQSKKVIHDYYYKPDPVFHGDGTRFFGLELEVDDAGERDSYAAEVVNIGNSDGSDHIYCKHDGSLDDGFEIVTQPMTLSYHLNHMPWEAVLKKLRQLGYLSHQAGTCGLHIHVSRAAFGETTEEQDACIARILYFFEKHWEELLKFSRRTNRQLERWAARYGYNEQPKDILEKAKGNRYGRYTCINLQNTDTIEFRMFRGTLKLNTLIATLQLVNKICDVALFLSDDELRDISWTSFVSGITNDTYPELVQYLKERRLYVNDFVAGEEEV